MGRHDDTVSLRQMLDNARKALSVVEGRSRSYLDDNWIPTLALIQLLQIVGEAARRLSEDFRARHPEVPWAEIIGFRNRLIHGYDTVDLDRLWRVLQDDLPPVARRLEDLLRSRA